MRSVPQISRGASSVPSMAGRLAIVVLQKSLPAQTMFTTKMVQLFGVENPTQQIAASNPSMVHPVVFIRGRILAGPNPLVTIMQSYLQARSRQQCFVTKNSPRVVRIALQISRAASLVTRLQLLGIDA